MATITVIAPAHRPALGSVDLMHLWRRVSPHELAERAEQRRRTLFPPHLVTLAYDGPVFFSNLCDGCDDHAEHSAPGDRAGFILTPEEAAAQASAAAGWGATRVTLRGGAWQGFALDDMEAILGAVRAAAPDAFVGGLTPTQIALGARSARVPVAVALDRLHRAGLQGICGADFASVLRGSSQLPWSDWRDIVQHARHSGIAVSIGIAVRPDDTYAALAELIEGLSAIADLAPASIVCRALPGIDGARDGRRFMKLVALARLVAPAGTHISVERSGSGLSLMALALTAGADDVVGPWEPDREANPALAGVRQRRLATETEAAIRDLGFTPSHIRSC
jgi:2-iminoacetate synthase ThiH